MTENWKILHILLGQSHLKRLKHRLELIRWNIIGIKASTKKRKYIRLKVPDCATFVAKPLRIS